LNQRGRSFGKGEMPWETAEKAVRLYASRGIREVIPSTMGEPLLYSHFEKLERLVQELGIRLNVTTNGTFPRKGALAWAKELLPISSDIKVSCWGFSQKSWDVLCPGMDARAYFQNLKTFVDTRQKLSSYLVEPISQVTLQMAVSQTNRDDVEQVIERALEWGIDRVKLNRAVFLSHSETLRKKEQLLPEDFLDASKYEALPLKLEGTFLYPATRNAPISECPFLGRELWILPDGSIELCPDPENRFQGIPPGKNRCEICQLFPKKFFSIAKN